MPVITEAAFKAPPWAPRVGLMMTTCVLN